MNATRFPSNFTLRLLVTVVLVTCATNRGASEAVLYEQKIRPVPVQIIVPVNVDGLTLPMGLDTGSTYHVLDLSLQSHLQREVRSTTAKIFGGSFEIKCARFLPTVGTWQLHRALP